MVLVFFDFFIYTKCVSDATICNQSKIIIPMGYNNFNRNERTFIYPILFSTFDACFARIASDRVFIVSVFFDLFIYIISVTPTGYYDRPSEFVANLSEV